MTSQVYEHDKSIGNGEPGIPSDNAGSHDAEEHVFSDSYQRRKQALIAEYGKEEGSLVGDGKVGSSRKRFKWRAVSIAAAAALVVMPVSAWAIASNSSFFAGAFGNDVRESVQAHDEVLDDGYGDPVTVTYPTREFVDADLEKAERLLGSYTLSKPQKARFGGHTLTVQSVVRDKDTMVVSYTLERKGGVTALVWDELSNEENGAYNPDDQPYSWNFIENLPNTGSDDDMDNYAGECTIVDPKRSTKDKLYCYAYIVFDRTPSDSNTLSLQVEKQVYQPSGDYYTSEIVKTIDLPMNEVVPERRFSAENVGTVDVSPISLLFKHSGSGDIVDEQIARVKYESRGDAEEGMSFDEFLEEYGKEIDLDLCAKAVLTFKDGSSYTVFDDLEALDNASYVLGRENNDVIWMFNRLVDPNEIESITINDVTFS